MRAFKDWIWVAGLAALCLPNVLSGQDYSDAHQTLVSNKTWRSFGGVESGGQYSALAQITPGNVKQLTRAWTARTGDVVKGGVADGGSSFQATPIVWNDTLFVCTPLNRVIALDGATGKTRWSFDAYSTMPDAPRFAANCRGVALWLASDPAELAQTCGARVIKPDIFGRLYALDARTGKLCPDFGESGIVELNELDYAGQGDIFLTSPPAVLGNLIIVGGGVGDNMVADAADGIVRALDARSGKVVWSFNPIPESLSNRTGGANVWSMIAVDPELDLVYLPTTSPSVDPYGVYRRKPIPYANALVALNAADGTVAWSFQTIHHDLFDYDLPAQPILVDVQIDDSTVRAVALVTKTGFVFLFDRRSGDPVHPIDEVAAPASTIPEEKAAATQPVPRLPMPFAKQTISEDDLWGLTDFDKSACKKRFEELRYDGLFTPPSLEGSIQMPSALGGSNWGGAAIDPTTGTLFVKNQNIPSITRLIPADVNETRPIGPPAEFLRKPLNGTPYRLDGEFFLSPLGIPCTAPPWGEIIAIDLASGEHRWRQPLGRYPLPIFDAPAAWGSPNVGGPIVTAGGLIFVGAGMDSTFRALDVKTGETLWEDSELPAPAMAVPASYEIDGTQYVVIAAGGSALAETKQSDAVIAYRLPKRTDSG